MSKKAKILTVAIVGAVALLGYWLYKKYAGGNADGYTDEKQPVDKSLRNFAPTPGKDARYAPSVTGKNAPFVGYTEKPAKDARFEPSDTGKNIRFI